MKKFLMASAASMALAGPTLADEHAESVALGVLLSYTGQIESLVPPIADGAELAVAEVNAAGGIMDGMTVNPVRGDTFCGDAAGATATAERVITSEGVVGVVGSDCSGMTTAILANVAVPNGVAMISPASTSPALSDAEDNGLFFRTAPSDARQGQVLAQVLLDRGVESIAISYTNNDYGQGFADALSAAFEEAGGEVTLVAAHEDDRADYSAEVGALASAGGDVLVVLGYVDSGGSGVIQAALDTGAFDTFAVGDGMVGDTLADNFGSAIDGSFGTAPGTDSDGADIYQGLAQEAGFDGSSVFSAEAYDAAALLMLAMQATGSTSAADYAPAIGDIANAPGETIMPGELGRALEILAEGGEIDYEGATGVELIGGGEAAGSYRIVEMQDGALETVDFR
jgi:branched-chain amino acid transport system substrate-binding protein